MRPNPLGSTISTAMTINTLVVLLLRPAGGGILAIRDGQIHLHKPLSLSRPGRWHVETGAAWSRRSGSSQTQYALQPQGAHALFLMVRYQAAASQTRSGVRLVKDGSRCHCALVLA